MRFTKMHGIGNDYVYVNCFEEQIDDPAALAVRISDRHFGVGSDGLILVMPSDKADVRMRMFNADGSEAEMCGNGLRCVSKFAADRQLVPQRPLDDESIQAAMAHILAQSKQQITVETGRGILTVGLALDQNKVEQVCLDMGEPILSPREIPVNITGQQAVGVPFRLDDENQWLMTCVSMGNPHVVFFVDDVAAVDLEHLGPRIETHEWFPNRINAHFVQRVSDNELIMRTWERGSGITLACGTGAAAVCVAGVLASKSDRQTLIHLPGGDLQLLWNDSNGHVYLTGPATEVFAGVWPD